MTVSLTPAAAALPSTVAIPADGELVNSSSVAGYVQVVLNGLAYDKAVTQVLHDGGTLAPTASVTLAPTAGSILLEPVAGGVVAAVPSGHSVNINGALSVAAAPDGGAVLIVTPVNLIGTTKLGTLIGALKYDNDTVSDAGRVPKRPVLGLDAGTSGAKHQIQPAIYNHVVFPPGLLTTSRHWQLTDTSFASGHGDDITFYNGDAGSNTITVYDPGGIELGLASPGNTVTFIKIGSNWHFGGGGT